MNHRIRRLLAFVGCLLFALPPLFALTLLGCASSPVDAPALMTLQSLHRHNPEAFTAKVCVLPEQAPADTRFIAADDKMTTIVSDHDRDAFERFLPSARLIYEFDPFARTSSAKLYPMSMNLSCPETFTVLRSQEDIENGAPRVQTVVRISTDVHRELRLMVEQTCKAASLEGTDRRYVGQQSGKTHPVFVGRTNPQFEARIAEILNLNRIPEPEPSGRRSVVQQLRDTPQGQVVVGLARGISKAVIPGGTIAVNLAREAHLLPEGTRIARIAEHGAELGVGIVQIAVGCTGVFVGTGVSGTGAGAPVGVPVVAGSIVLTTVGLANAGNSIQHLTIELWRTDDSDGMVSSSPPSQAKPAEPTPQTAKPAPGATTPAGASAPGSGQTTLRNAHLAGKKHPKTGVPFDKDGYPDFRAAGVVKKEVKIKFSGDQNKDFREANAAAGFKQKPEGFSWHHHQDGTTMQLVPMNIHRATGHTGGSAITKKK